MIKKYLLSLKSFISACEKIKSVVILRESVWETDIEIIALIRYKLILTENSIIEITERLIESDENLERTKYSYHW